MSGFGVTSEGYHTNKKQNQDTAGTREGIVKGILGTVLSKEKVKRENFWKARKQMNQQQAQEIVIRIARKWALKETEDLRMRLLSFNKMFVQELAIQPEISSKQELIDFVNLLHEVRESVTKKVDETGEEKDVKDLVFFIVHKVSMNLKDILAMCDNEEEESYDKKE